MADPQFFGGPLVPSLYHSQNCTNQEDTITTKSCVPVNNQECEDIEIPQQKIEVVNNCKTITVQQCGLEPVETEAAAEAVEAERKKREAEADPQVLLHTPYLAAPRSSCLWKTTVECKDVEHKIPKVVCEAVAPLP